LVLFERRRSFERNQKEHQNAECAENACRRNDCQYCGSSHFHSLFSFNSLRAMNSILASSHLALHLCCSFDFSIEHHKPEPVISSLSPEIFWYSIFSDCEAPFWA
jgi:hypothetical protein